VHGSVNHQITKIFTESGIFQPGTSRHNEKIEIKEQLTNAGQSRASQSVADKSVMHAYETSRDYKDTWHKLGHFCRAQYRLKDMSQITKQHVQGYLEKRMQDGISYDTWGKEASHIAKFGNALERFDGQHRGFRGAINDLRELARDSLAKSSKTHGGFARPDQVVQNLTGKSELISRVQLEGGARLREATLIKAGQLKGIDKDPITGHSKGVIHLTDTKGGKPRDIQVSPDTYKRLEQAVEHGNGVFRVNRNTYRNHVSQAAKTTDEQRTGTHDFRYNFAQTRYGLDFHPWRVNIPPKNKYDSKLRTHCV
jgi:integrase